MGAPSPAVVHLPRWVAELPPGWTRSEGVLFTSPSGTAATVRIEGAGDRSATELLDDHVAAVVAECDGEAPGDPRPASLGGLGAVRRTVRFRRDDRAWTMELACAVDEGLVVTVSASFADDVEGGAEDAEAVLAGVRLLDRAPAPDGTGEGEDRRRSPRVRRPALDHDVFGALRRRWDGGVTGDVRLADPVTCSPDELAVASELMGGTAFPTVGSELLGALPQDSRTATTAAVARGLLARGLIEARDADLVPTDETAELLAPALAPQLAVTVQVLHLDHGHLHWFGVDSDAGTWVRVLSEGPRELLGFRPEALVGLVMDATGTVPGAPRDARNLPAVVDGAFLLESPDDVVSVVRVRTNWLEDDVLVNGELAWLVDANGAGHPAEERVDETAVTWDLAAVNGTSVTDHLLDHLPHGS